MDLLSNNTGSGDINSKAEIFLSEIMRYYIGSTEYKLNRAEEFLDSVLFKAQGGLLDPFSNDLREEYDIAYISRYHLIPKLKKKLNVINNTDPYNIHKWN